MLGHYIEFNVYVRHLDSHLEQVKALIDIMVVYQIYSEMHKVFKTL